MEYGMKTRMILTLLAAVAAATAAASTRADEGAVAASGGPARCRLVTGALKTNFGTLDPASVSSQAHAAAMDYRCAGAVHAGGSEKSLPVALYWTVAPAGDADAGVRTIATTFGTGGILGIARPAAADGGFVSVVVAP